MGLLNCDLTVLLSLNRFQHGGHFLDLPFENETENVPVEVDGATLPENPSVGLARSSRLHLPRIVALLFTRLHQILRLRAKRRGCSQRPDLRPALLALLRCTTRFRFRHRGRRESHHPLTGSKERLETAALALKMLHLAPERRQLFAEAN